MERRLVHDEPQDAERLFLSSIRSEVTKRAYTIYLKKFVEIIKCRNINDLLNLGETKDIENKIINFIIGMKEQGNNYSAIRNYVRPVISFYKINDIILNTTKIGKFMPSKTRVKKNRGYSYEEIQRLLSIADERMKAVILLMVSSGLRVGALPELHVRDLEKKGDIYKITVYENEQEEYYSFCTMETAQALDAYLSMRSRYGERINPDSPLIREQFNIRDQFAALSPKKVKAANLSHKIGELAERAGIREKTLLKEGEKSGSIRNAVPISHGLRKAFSTFTLNSNVDIIKRRMMQGHSIGIDEHYCKPSENDLLLEYETKCLDSLTIDPSKRLQRKVEKLEEKDKQIEKLMKKQVQVEELIQTLIDSGQLKVVSKIQ